MCLRAHVEHSHNSCARRTFPISKEDVLKRRNLAKALFLVRSIDLHTSAHNARTEDHAAAIRCICD